MITRDHEACIRMYLEQPVEAQQQGLKRSPRAVTSLTSLPSLTSLYEGRRRRSSATSPGEVITVVREGDNGADRRVVRGCLLIRVSTTEHMAHREHAVQEAELHIGIIVIIVLREQGRGRRNYSWWRSSRSTTPCKRPASA